MRRASALSAVLPGLLASVLAGLSCPSAWAVEYPTQYSGSIRLTVTVRNQFGSGLCAEDGPLSITLLADGTLKYDIGELVTQDTTQPGQPATCDIRPTSKTNHLTGTHDFKGQFSVPSGSPSFPPLTGRYDDDHITAEYTAGAAHMAFDLPAVSHRIALEPDPSRGFDFHKSILRGQGFKLVIRDPQGRDHLDLGTLKILVGGDATTPGTDTTQYALSRLMQGLVPLREESPDSRTRVFHLLPDPKKLMQGHDIFAIPFNGDWRIEFRICDKAQTCFNAVYTVYFGPFVSTLPLRDGRCADAADPTLQVSAITVGNIGIDSPRTALYVALATPDLRDIWTHYFDDFGDGTGRFAWWQGQVQAFIPTMDMPSGFLLEQDLLLLPDWVSVPAGSGPPYQRKLPFPSGTFTFVTAALDTGTGAYRRDEHPVAMCDR